MSNSIAEIWDKNYSINRFNKMPYNEIVSYAFRKIKSNGEVKNNVPLRVLDLGCGGGNNLKFLHELGFEVWGVDASAKAVELTRGVVTEELTERIKQADFKKLPFEDSFFDFVIDRASIGCNLSQDLHSIFEECCRVIKTAGELYSTNLCALDHPHLKFGKNLGKGDFVEFEKGVFYHATQIHAFNPDELLNFLSAFQKIEIEKITNSKYNEKLGFVPDIISYNVTAIK